MTKVGDHDVSPYLTQRLRTIEEVQAERERRRQALGGDAETAGQKPLPAPKPPAVEPSAPSDKAAGRPGQILDEKA